MFRIDGVIRGAILALLHYNCPLALIQHHHQHITNSRRYNYGSLYFRDSLEQERQAAIQLICRDEESIDNTKLMVDE